MNKIKAVAFDLDGTIYIGNRIIDGAMEVITLLKEKNIQVLYFTNNSTRTRCQMFEKLIGMGLGLNEKEVYNSAFATAVFTKQKGMNNVYCIGAQGLRDELNTAGISLIDDKEAANGVIVGLDPDFNYQELSKALDILRKEDRVIIACNRDRNYPVEGGRILPGCGPIVAAIEDACGREVDYVVGKPGTFMLDLLAKDWRLKAEDILIVGDSYESDIAMAKSYGSPSVLISDKPHKKEKDVVTVNDIAGMTELFS